MLNKIIVALDNFTQEDALSFINNNPKFEFYKIGLELYIRYGRQLVEEVTKKHKKKVFLDLKLHDIPNTVSKAISSLEGLDIDFLTIHTSGGKEMLEASVKARNEFIPNTKLLGVTVLTSLDESDMNSMYGIHSLPVSRLIQVAESANIDGIVCSAADLESIQTTLLKVCPGIRLNLKESHDQKRVLDPKSAFEKGANFLVMGRSLTKNPNLKESINYIEKL